MRGKVLAIALAIAAFAAESADANVYNLVGTFTYPPDPTVTLDVDLVTSSAVPSLVTGISGTVDGDAVTGLSPYADADNELLSVTPTYVDTGGISFTTSADTYNFYAYNGANYICAESFDDICYTSQGDMASSLSVTSVPEPAAWTLMLVGVAALGAGLRARRSALAAA